MRKQILSCIGAVALFSALIIAPASLRAETALPSGNADANAPTRLEFTVTATVPPPKIQAPPKPGTEPPSVEAMEKQRDALEKERDALGEKALENGIDKAVRLGATLASQWPKCHFRIASITSQESKDATGGAPPVAPSPAMLPFMMGSAASRSMLVTLLGDSGCLSQSK
jgi:hypothetical protein